ncbi:hypothetical protein MGG_15746 [Pyricularia oryzae 70-15]|uniref:Uncharacterized protein n=2 Tax=Pyricularia oryzae TaxID=318829 RepID=G4MUC9_PYRO7|nr:uncharacterized protein MGG_15746 [Pyricularia oryzae 70-15]EHA54816.1 hypothetical protein MGG_15746 [Pyricularia oryzae 70-15]QBZ56465.1 hypothetical protein PoMZ_01372 [Pyricularia oryzae]
MLRDAAPHSLLLTVAGLFCDLDVLQPLTVKFVPSCVSQSGNGKSGLSGT